jgi:nitronate monooxygenase
LYIFVLIETENDKTYANPLKINRPLIMAPMFLVSNTKMVIEGMKSGVAGCIQH